MNHLHSESVDAPEILGLRPCLRPPIPEIAIAARLMRDAVTAHIEGRFGEAENLLDKANIDAIKDWADLLIGKFSEYNTPRFRLSPSAKGFVPEQSIERSWALVKEFIGMATKDDGVRALSARHAELQRPKWYRP